MLDQRQVHLGRQAAEAVGDLDVGAARGRVARGVVVGEEEPCGADAACAAVDQPEIDPAIADPAAPDRIDPEQVERVIHIKREQPLVRFLRQARHIFEQGGAVANVPRMIERRWRQIVIAGQRQFEPTARA